MAGLASLVGAMLIALSGTVAEPTATLPGTAVRASTDATPTGISDRSWAITVEQTALSAPADGLADEPGDQEDPPRLRVFAAIALPSAARGCRLARPLLEQPPGAIARPRFLTCRHFEC